jgi:hypothetical protein
MCKSTSLILHNSKICCLQCNSNQRKEPLRSTRHWPIPPSSNWNIWMFTQIGQCVLTRVCQFYLESKRVRGSSPFCLDYFPLSKSFNYIAMDVSILHFKLGNNSKPSYSISTFSRHIPHYHSWPITSCWLLRWRVFDI